MSLADSVRDGLAALEPIDDRDRAAADLAELYAEAIDEIEADRDSTRWQDRQRDPLAELGPKLLAALTALGMTPAARKAATTPTPERPTSPLDELRDDLAEQRARRTGG